METSQHYTALVCAFIRGRLAAEPAAAAEPALFELPLDELGAPEVERLLALGRAHGLRLHKFERTMGLPRVRKVLGALRGLAPASLLDVGSGRGAFLWPLLDAFPALPVTCVDLLERRVLDIQAVARGGRGGLAAHLLDATALPFDDRAFDVVTALEVLEHIPDVRRALSEVCRVAARCVIVSVPSKADTNPEHIHLFDQRRLESMLRECGVARVKLDFVPNHMIAIGMAVSGF